MGKISDQLAAAVNGLNSDELRTFRRILPGYLGAAMRQAADQARKEHENKPDRCRGGGDTGSLAGGKHG